MPPIPWLSSGSASPASPVLQNLPPISNIGWETDSEISSPPAQEVESDDDYFTIVNSEDEKVDEPAAGNRKVKTGAKPVPEVKKNVTFKCGAAPKSKPSPQSSTRSHERSTQRKKPSVNIAPAKLIKYGGDLGELTVFEWGILPYPPKIEVRGLLPDGLPEFTYQQVFGQLPPQVEINLELLTDRRIGFATRFVLDATVAENVVQMRVLDEFTDPPTRRSRQLVFVPWAYMQAVPTEWTKEAVRVRRYTSLQGEYPPTFLIDVSVTAAKNLKPGVQILGEPFAKRYVVSYAKFDEDEGAIAVRFGPHVEWIPYMKYTPDPPRRKNASSLSEIPTEIEGAELFGG